MSILGVAGHDILSFGLSAFTYSGVRNAWVVILLGHVGIFGGDFPSVSTFLLSTCVSPKIYSNKVIFTISYLPGHQMKKYLYFLQNFTNS